MSDICYATQNRQRAVRELARHVDLMLVVGAQNSSNSNRLREIGGRGGGAELPDRPRPRARPGLARRRRRPSGSPPAPRRPRRWCEELIERLRALGPVEVETLPGIEENVEFRLPAGAG